MVGSDGLAVSDHSTRPGLDTYLHPSKGVSNKEMSATGTFGMWHAISRNRAGGSGCNQCPAQPNNARSLEGMLIGAPLWNVITDSS